MEVLDNMIIFQQLGMSSHENATPIRVLHNSAGHLSGPSRSLGGVVIGYLGVRVFCPRPVAVMLDTVGGCSVLLGEFNSLMLNIGRSLAIKAKVSFSELYFVFQMLWGFCLSFSASLCVTTLTSMTAQCFQ